MSEISQVTTPSGLIIYNNRKADVYRKDEIYDPENPQSGKYFPSLNSIIIDNGSLWYVVARNEVTYAVTLAPCSFITKEEDEVQIISYGNDNFCIYQDERTNPHKLVVDAKLLFYGNNLAEYTLHRVTSSNKEEIISVYLDNTDSFVSNRIPLVSISEEYPSYKYPTNCHTTHDLVEGEPVILRVYNNLGNLVAELTCFVRNAVWLNDLSSHTNPIVKLDAECLQTLGDAFFIYAKQDPSHLNIKPYLMYADGTKVYIDVDNVQCFLYGLEDYIPSFPGHSQKLILKYFLNYREASINSTTTDQVRFLTCEKDLIVVNNTNSFDCKVSIIPMYNSALQKWELRFFAYTENRDAVYGITDKVTFDEEFPFVGTNEKWGVEQHIEILYDLQSIFNSDDPMPGAQSFWITVWDPVNRYVRYTFKDSESSVIVYGTDSSILRKPIIHYDETIDMYFIPTSVFQNKEAVIEAFYTMASPPIFTKIEGEAPTPTHFTIRDASNGQMLIGGLIPITEYGQAWNTIIGTPKLAGRTVIVEFEQEVNGVFNILYGVPVDVVNSPTGYNTETN